jgi:PAS domain S-box-containing protein
MKRMSSGKGRPGGALPSASEPADPTDIFASERGLRALLEALPAAIYATDAAGRLNYYNDAAAALWGRRPEPGAAIRSWKLFSPDGAPLPDGRSPMALALAQRRAIRGMEAIAERPDGSRVRLAFHPTPTFDAAGALIGAVDMVVDTTDRTRAEEALRARGAELEAVIDRTPFMLARLGRDLRYRFISRAYARMIDRRPEDVIGQSIAEIIGEDGFTAVRPHIEKVLTGEPTEYELEICFPGIGPRLLRGIYTPERDEAGNVDGWIASILDIGEQRRAEHVRQQLAGIVDSSGDAIVSRDLEGMIVSWNRAAEWIFGYSAEEAIGRPIEIVIPPEYQDEESKIITRIRRGEHIEHFETVRRRKDGRLIDVSLTVSPVKNAAGTIVGASKITRDNTERRQADMALAKRAEEQKALYEFTNRLYRAESLSAVYEAALDAILSALHCRRASIQRFDEHGVMRFAAWRGLSAGYRRAIEGHSPWSRREVNPEPVCLADAAGADLPAAIKTVIAQEGIGALAFIPIVANGKVAGKFMAYYEAPHAFATDEIDLALNLARQLGFAVERMQAEQARQAAEQDLRALSERLETEVEKRTLERDRIWNVSEDLLGVSNFEGYFISINPAWMRLLGWSEQDIKSMHVSELRHPDDAAHSEAGRAQLAQGVPTVRMENRLRHKDGSWRWISWTMTAENGLIYVAGRHVTLEKEAAAALEQAQRQAAQSQKMEALGQLTGGVAHDFNNLLMIVSGHAQRLQRRLTDPCDVRALEAIQIASTRGESLTRQLLSFSRGQPLNPTVIDPAETVNGIRDVLSGSLHVNIALAIEVAPTIWPLRVDKSEIELALLNLVVNARDAMPEGGRLSISAENVRLNPDDARDGLTGDFVALRVSDTGCGIANEIVAKVFEPFFTTKTAEKGTGLGLSQVYGFARRSGGTVAIASEVGRGTTVSLYLPRSHGQVERPSTDDSDQLLAAGEETVLVVEDNEDVRAVAVSLLEQLGYRTVAVESAPAALARLAAGESPDLIFTDVVLPGEMDGLALARTVKERYPDVPIVLTTGYAKIFETDPEFPVLCKPYQIAALARVIRGALDSAKLAVVVGSTPAVPQCGTTSKLNRF